MSDSSNIQNSLFEAMKIFSESATANSKASITIEGVITSIEDEATGVYLIEYLGSSFKVHSNNDTSYSVGDSVYVLVPDGDFSKEKIILGSISANIYNSSSVDNSYYAISDNLIDNFSDTIKMSSYDTIKIGDKKVDVTTYDKDVFGKIVSGYLKDYKIFKFSFSVKTTLELSQQNKGNYGVCLYLPILESAAAGEGVLSETWKEIYLDVGNFIGTPYRFTAWAPQEVYFAIDEQYTYDVSRLPYYSYYCYDFTQDSTKTTVYDIQLKDLSLQIMNDITLDESGYSLSLKATQGEYYSTYYDNVKTITPTLKINGKTTTLAKSQIYWFIEDTSVKADSEYYVTYGGYGWKCLNTKTNIGYDESGTQTFDYITTVQTREVNRSEVKAATRFKCVVIYNSKVLSAIVTLKNLTIDASIQLTSSKNLSTSYGITTIADAADNTYMKDVGYVNLSSIVYYAGITTTEDNRNRILYTWARYDKDGNYINDASDFFTSVVNNQLITFNGKVSYLTQVRFPVNKLEEFNTVYCTAKYVDIDSYYNRYEEQIGTSSLGISTSTQYDLNLAINGDSVVYKYDSDGDSPMGTAYDGPSTSKVTEISPLTYTLTKLDGSELTAEEYKQVHYKWIVPKESLFSKSANVTPTSEDSNNYYYEGYGNSFNLVYSIASRFNIGKVKAAINLIINFQNKTLEKSATINFIKEGMSGTNGTAYTALLISGGTSASDEKSVAYGILNSNGVAQKLKFVYNSISGVLYRHDYDNNSLVVWSTDIKRIYPQVWRDSTILAYGTHYDVEYSMFDSTTTGACFVVTKQADGSCVLSLASTPAARSCNIVQAKVTINDGNTSSTNSQQIIYCYYPIEITITNFTPAMIPSLDGGFAEVMYASDGTNPSYDETEFFTINDDKVIQSDLTSTANYFNIDWETQYHLGMYEVDSEGKPKGTKKTSGVTTSTVKVKPDNKYDDGNSKNYVLSTINFNTSKKTELQTMRGTCETNILNAENIIIQENLNYGYITSLIDSYNSYVGVWYSNLDSIKSLLSVETNSIYTLDKLQNENIAKINEYIAYQKQYSSKSAVIEQYTAELQASLSTLSSKVAEAKIAILQLDGTTGHVASDLISLENYVIIISEEEEQEWRDNLGREMTEVLLTYIDRINEQINLYQNYYITLKKDIYTSYLATYNQIKVEIDSVGNLIPSTAYTRYVNLKNLILSVKDSFNSGVSYDYLINQLKVLENILSTIAIADSNHSLTILESITNEKVANVEESTEIKQTNTDTRNCIDTILNTEGYTIYHIRPIVLYFNRYEMSNINAWDGNKVTTADGYLLAPQVGAGSKESDNSFTGVVMGLKKLSATSNIRKGLYGYYKGTQSFMLDAEDGAAVFGKSGTGQIIIDPSDSNTYLYSSNYWKNYNSNTGLPSSYEDGNKSGSGLCLDLKNSKIHFGSSLGVIYSGSHSALTNTSQGFYLSHDGLSIGAKAKIVNDGTMYLGDGAVNGTSKHWTINGGSGNSYISYGTSGSSGSVFIGTDKLTIGSKFFVDAADGSMRLGTGAVNNTGKHWTISGGDNSYIAYGTTSFNSGANSVYVGTDGISLGQDKFYVDNSGSLVSKSGTIGGWTISSSTLVGGKTTLNSNGTIDCNKLIANTSGSIGGWTIGSSTLKGGSTTLNSNGTIECSNLIANTSGSIGGWTIGSSTLKGGSTTLNSNGTITCSTLIANTSGSIGGWTINGSTLTNGTLTLGNGQILGPNFVLGASGLGYVQGGTTVTTSGTELTESSTNIGSKNIGTWTVDTIKAHWAEFDELIVKNHFTYEGKQVGWDISTPLVNVDPRKEEITYMTPDGGSETTSVVVGLSLRSKSILFLGYDYDAD